MNYAEIHGEKQLTKWQLSYGKGLRANQFPTSVYYDTDVGSNIKESVAGWMDITKHH